MATTRKQKKTTPVKKTPSGAAVRGPRQGVRSWAAFQRRLAEALAFLEDEQYIFVTHKTEPYFVQFACFGRAGIRAEAISNGSLKEGEKLDRGKLRRLKDLGWLHPTVSREEAETASHRDGGGTPNYYRDWPHPAPFAEVAALAVTTLRDVFEVKTPTRLCYRARNRRRERILLPTLGLNLLREGSASTQERTAELVWPRTWEQLQQTVLDALRQRTGNPGLRPDGDGDIPIRWGSALVWVQVNQKVPVIDLFSSVLRDVQPTSDLLEALNELNQTRRPATFAASDSVVCATIRVDCTPLYPPNLFEALEFLGRLVDETDGELCYRFGGRTAFEHDEVSGRDSVGATPN